MTHDEPCVDLDRSIRDFGIPSRVPRSRIPRVQSLGILGWPANFTILHTRSPNSYVLGIVSDDSHGYLAVVRIVRFSVSPERVPRSLNSSRLWNSTSSSLWSHTGRSTSRIPRSKPIILEALDSLGLWAYASSDCSNSTGYHRLNFLSSRVPHSSVIFIGNR